MSDDGQQLLLTFEARFERYMRGFERAQQQTDRRFKAIEARSKQAGKRMEDSMSSTAGKINATLAGLGKGAMAGLVGAATIGSLNALVGRIGAVAEGVANIGSEAKRAGVSTRVFQEWGHVARQTRIPLDALIDGFKELAIRGDEFAVTGKGSGEEAFKRLGFSASDLARRLKDPSALMLEIIGRMERLDRSAQIRVADEVFGGTAGERFVELLGMGEAGIQRLITEANDFGLVLDDGVIAKADEIDRKFKLIASTVGTNLAAAGKVLGSLFGFSEGGYTGQGGKYQPKGIVHGGEFVMSKAATERLGVANLDALHTSALRGFSSGGYVGGSPAISPLPASVGAMAAPASTPNITIAPSVTVNASGGTPEQNQDLANRTSRAVENQVRAIVQGELRQAMRPGGALRR